MKLYKYRPINEFTFKIFETHSLFFASPNSFNDPFDCAFNVVNTDLELMQLKEVIEEVQKKAPEYSVKDLPKEMPIEIRKELIGYTLNSFRSEFAILCFSLRSDNILMWSHYAQDHKGICLEFDFEPTDMTHFMSTTGSSSGPVEYSKKMVEVDFIKVVKSIDENFEKAFYVKNSDWSYEEEFRFIRHSKPFSCNFDPNILKAVILGPKCDSEFMVTAIVEKYNSQYGTSVKIKKGKVDQAEFKVNIVD